MNRASEILDLVRREGRDFVMEPEVYEILESYEIPVVPWSLAISEEEAVSSADEIGYPVVMKVVSPQVIHKTEYGAVKVGVDSAREVREAFSSLTANVLHRLPGAEIHGILITKMVSGRELIIGSTRDLQFGPLLMFGLGGIFVEVFRDVSYRIAPIEPIDANEMINELRGQKLLEGFRGTVGVNKEALISALVKISHMLADLEQIKEMDLNPVFGNEEGVMVADARILLD